MKGPTAQLSLIERAEAMQSASRSSIARGSSPMPVCWMPHAGSHRRCWRPGDLDEERVLFLVAPGFPWVAVQWGIWRAGGIAVPLPLGSPPAELEYFIDDTQAGTLLTDAAGDKVLAPLAAARGLRQLSCDQAAAAPSEATFTRGRQQATRDDSVHQRNHQPA